MTTLAREMGASYAFIERNFFLVKRYWGWEMAFLVYAIAGAMSITLIGTEAGSAELVLSLMIGAVFWNYLSTVFSIIAEQIAWERWEGTLEYTMMAPVRRASQLFGSTAFAIVYGLIHTTVVLTALVLFFGLDLSGADFGAAAVFMLLGSLSVIGIGMMAAVLPLLYVERGAQMTFVIQSLLLLVSGVYYSVTILPQWMQVLAKFSPFTYVLEGVRAALIDGTPISELLYLVWPLIIMAVVFIPLGIWVFGRAERYAKRTGKLKRVGWNQMDLVLPVVDPSIGLLPLPLAAFGWTPEREAAFSAHAEAGLIPGRVVSTGGVMRAQTTDGPVDVVFQRRFRRAVAGPADLPAVGDWLALEPMHGSGLADRQAAVRAVLPRTSAFARGEATSGQHIAEQVVAANVDTAFLVSALTHDLNPRRIERYLLLAWASGAAPVIVLNKADLAADLATSVAAVAAVAGDVPIHPVSAVTLDGLAGLRPYLGPGRTVCLLGSSGVGKSTLANALLGEARQLVRAERVDDSRGRHTTTARELFPLPGGALLIDTPGLRSVGLWDDGKGLDQAFEDIAVIAERCRFRDCAHRSEPGCAVRAAIAAGELAEERLASHDKLERELRALDLRSDAAAGRAESRRLGRMYRVAGKTAQLRREADL